MGFFGTGVPTVRLARYLEGVVRRIGTVITLPSIQLLPPRWFPFPARGSVVRNDVSLRPSWKGLPHAAVLDNRSWMAEELAARWRCTQAWRNVRD
jgi:hypothetical protein